MKKLLLTVAILFISITAFADDLIIPFALYPKEAQKAFAKYKLKLDLNGNDRTEKSFAWLENRGNEFIIHSYKTLTKEDFDIISKVLFGENYGTKK